MEQTKKTQNEVEDLRGALHILLDVLEESFPTIDIRPRIEGFLTRQADKRNLEQWEWMENVHPQIRTEGDHGHVVDGDLVLDLLLPIVDIAVGMWNGGPQETAGESDLLHRYFPGSRVVSRVDDRIMESYLQLQMSDYGSRSTLFDTDSVVNPVVYQARLYLEVPLVCIQTHPLVEYARDDGEIRLVRYLHNTKTLMEHGPAYWDIELPYFHSGPLLDWCARHCHNRKDPLVTYGVLMDDLSGVKPTWLTDLARDIAERHQDAVLVDWEVISGPLPEAWDTEMLHVCLCRENPGQTSDEMLLCVPPSGALDEHERRVDLLQLNAEDVIPLWSGLTLRTRMALLTFLTLGRSEKYYPVNEPDGEDPVDPSDLHACKEVDNFIVVRSFLTRAKSDAMTAETEELMQLGQGDDPDPNEEE